MYHLMKSEKLILDHPISGIMSSYRQIEIDRFEQFAVAHDACEAANDDGRSRYYLVNESGQEYYDGTWID